ncbi:reticulon-4-interacting protein [Metarhizium brunneum]
MAQPNLPASMRTVRQRDKLTRELALAQTPVPMPSQPAGVLVEVAVTALCYSELTWVSQNPRFFPPDKEPVPGQDMSGTVIQDGPGSSPSSKPGDQVFCRIDAYRRCQTDSDYSVNITILSERVMRITAKTTG